MTTHLLRLFLLAILLLPAAIAPAPAAAPAAASTSQRDAGVAAVRPVLPADGGVSLGKWLSGGRSRVVQLCVVAMCVALFIMMRKLA